MNNILEVIRKMKSLKELYGMAEEIYPYYHTTFKVEKLNEFIEVIMGFEKILRKNNSYTKKMIYRGMANDSWEPIPSVARNRKLEINEKELIHELKYRYPDNFSNLNTNFEMLANMQHYGLPTRLLDFTENPIIALYFACREMKTRNGRILCLYDYVNPYMNVYANILCDIACNGRINEKIDLYTKKYNISPLRFLSEMYYGHPYVSMKPPYWNERQKRQRSIFLIFSSLVCDSYGQAIYYEYDYNINKRVRLSIEEHEDLTEIFENSMWEPRNYFIEKYPSKQALSFILDKYSWKLMNSCYEQEDIKTKERNFTNRFSLNEQLEIINEDNLENDFCSIIIPAKCKKTILEELNFIGINESFVYPEINFAASEIVNNYINK